jgi:hypothetical protein
MAETPPDELAAQGYTSSGSVKKAGLKPEKYCSCRITMLINVEED